jgi:hypothetical protein
MAIEFPQTEIPVGFDGPVFIDNGRAFVSPLSQSMQFIGSATQLHQATLITRPMDTDAMRVLKAITDKALRDEIIIPIYERLKLDAATLGSTNYVTDDGVLVTDEGFPVWDDGPYVGSLIVSSASAFTLSVTGGPSALGFKAGQTISISTGGRWYLYTLAADSAASDSHTLTLTSSIRAAHAASDVVAINRAKMQGRAEPVWTSDAGGCFYQLSLTVRETQ